MVIYLIYQVGQFKFVQFICYNRLCKMWSILKLRSHLGTELQLNLLSQIPN